MSVNKRFQIPPREQITRLEIGRTRGPQHVSEMGNEVPGKHVSNNGHWLVCSVRCGTILLKVANPEEKNADHLVPPSPSAYLLSTTHSKDVRFPWVTLYFHSPVSGFSLLVFKVSISHTTHHRRYNSSGRVINPSQRPLPDNTQHSQQTNIHDRGGIRTHNLSRREAENLCLRPCGHWDRLVI